jgi:hypothetical protein
MDKTLLLRVGGGILVAILLIISFRKLKKGAEGDGVIHARKRPR